MINEYPETRRRGSGNYQFIHLTLKNFSKYKKGNSWVRYELRLTFQVCVDMAHQASNFNTTGSVEIWSVRKQ